MGEVEVWKSEVEVWKSEVVESAVVNLEKWLVDAAIVVFDGRVFES